MRRESWNIVAVVAGVLMLAVGGPWLVREIQSLPTTTLAARSEQRIVTLEVGGMTCGGCAAAVKSRLVEVPGVAMVDVRYKQRRAYVVVDRATPDTALTAAVGRAGPGFLAAVAAR